MCFGVFFVGGNEPDGEYLRSQSTNVALIQAQTGWRQGPYRVSVNPLLVLPVLEDCTQKKISRR